jgi:geranylgeranyl diphosphate synthase, type I
MEYLDRRRSLVDERLSAVVADLEPDLLRSEVGHTVLSGGKRVRPTMTIIVCEAVGGTPEAAVDFGVGVELVHNASLVIDDIIDDSAVRRGTESAWSAFGYGPAIVSSDAHLGEAFALFSRDARAMQIVAEAMVELGEGEAIELVAQPENEAEYMELARRKTGALFRAAAEVGAVAADADAHTVEAVGEYAERVGIAFQIRDDVLDATADAEELGKPTGQDAEMDRPSLLQVTDLDPEEANERARSESEAALSALSRVEVADTQAYEYLRDLAEFVVVRER